MPFSMVADSCMSVGCTLVKAKTMKKSAKFLPYQKNLPQNFSLYFSSDFQNLLKNSFS